MITLERIAKVMEREERSDEAAQVLVERDALQARHDELTE